MPPLCSFASLILFILCCPYITCATSTLRHIQLFFRHGERTPTTYLTFPSEHRTQPPNMTEFEVGEMTNKGMRQVYELGKNLRSLYGYFLGELYKSKEISVFSGRDNRTVASAQLLLAGLFPPRATQIWNPDLLWQPIPVETVRILDHVSFGMFDDCPAETKRVETSAQYAQIWAKFAPLVKELAEKTEVDIPNLPILQKVTDAIVTRAGLPDLLPLPKWAASDAFIRRIWQARLNLHEQVVDIFLESMGGWHFDRLVGRMDDVVNNRSKQRTVLYSGHDTNILTLGRFLNIAPINDTFLSYASFIAFELHQQQEEDGRGEYFVEIKSHPELNGTLSRLDIPDCPSPCSFGRFRSLRRRTTTAQWMSICLGEPANGVPWDNCSFYGPIAGILIVLVVLLLGFLLSLFWSCRDYKRRYRQLSEERQPLLVGRKLQGT